MSEKRLSGSRIKLLHIVTILLASGLALLSWTQTWILATIVTQAGAEQRLDVDGSIAAPALTALALAGLALAGALTIAGPVIRIILGFLEALIGFSIALEAFSAIFDPAAASASAVTAATGIAGPHSVVAGVVSAELTFWPYLAIVAAGIMMVVGVSVIVTVGRWPGPSNRHQAVRLEPAAPADGGDTGHAAPDDNEPGTNAPGDHPQKRGDAVGDWDDLSRGEDPTR